MWRRKHHKINARENNLRQQLLRGQIDSHFLYHAVNGLERLVQTGNTDDATHFIQRLAQLFRLSLENARQPFVPLENELDALTCYLKLQKALLVIQFDYHIDVEGITDQKAILIPPMLLQPFVENAILHGFDGQQEKGQLNIQVQKINKALHCIIEDNGSGLQSAETNNDQKQSFSTVINKGVWKY